MKKHIILLALAAAAFAACEKPVPYETGAPMDLNGPNVYFSDANSIDLVLPSDVNTFEVEVCRENATDALSVPLKALCGVDGAFVVPEKVEFASGADKAVVKVCTSAHSVSMRQVGALGSRLSSILRLLIHSASLTFGHLEHS